MNGERRFGALKVLIFIVCLLLVVAAIGTAVWLDREDMLPAIFDKPSLWGETTQPTQSTTEGLPDETVTDEVVEPTLPPDNPSSQVTLPTVEDPDTGESVVNFPCRVPGYDLVVEKLAPYNGMYVEDGSNRQVTDVAMLLVRNEGNYPVEYAEIAMQYGQQQLVFRISALPAGGSAVVQERSQQKAPEEKPSGCKALVVQRAQMGMAEQQVSVTENGDGTLTVRNLTDQVIPTVRIFYKYYMKSEDIFVGGIAFTVRITRLGGNSETTIQPSHYTSDSSRIVMVSTYE